MNVTDINTADKSKKKIQSIAKSNNLDFDLVYSIFCFHWNYDGIEGDWVTNLEKDTAYQQRYEFIKGKLNLSNEKLDKTQVINEIENKLTTINKTALTDNFIFGATHKNYCYVSEFASFNYLNNATKEKLNGLEWKQSGLTFEKIIKQIFLKIFRGGSIDRYNLEYLFSDLTINLPYENLNSKIDNWTEDFIQNLNNKKQEMKLSDLVQNIKNYCKGDKYFLQSVLEALSYSNTLKVDNYSVENIFIPDCREKLSAHYNSNEWTYPLRFWNEK
jgi:hypothetical protein